VTAPDRPPLDAADLRHAVLVPGSVWRTLDVVAETGSTNADLIARARQGEDIDGAVLIAENQTAGRGRNGRDWTAVPRSQVLMSVGVAAAAVPSEEWGWLPLATGVAVVDAVADVAGVQTKLKWPNDVLAGDGKLAGILAEVAAPQPVIVIGLGLNVTLRRSEIADAVATSLTELGVASPDRAQLVRRLLGTLGDRIAGWKSTRGADDRLMSDYLARSATIGVTVRAALPGGREIVGTATGIDRQGRLLVDTLDGAVTLSAGDVVHLRPAE
jgi:BirA family transcriptional regulator, biotin operon repressor / biotin---[acetyl-CoA-carboxylase] ligase